jgi:primosomal protein N' (replication factor Y) (superfamily II helicase)
MHIIEVIPLSVLPPQVPQVLSYYAENELLKGSVVEVPLHNRNVPAIVISSNEIDNQRIRVKKSAFQIKKIIGILSAEPQVSEYQFKLALWLASEYISPLGLALKTTLPPFFLKKKYPIKISGIKSSDYSVSPEVVLCRAKETVKFIPELKGQTLILVPEINYISIFKKKFPDADIIHSALKNKDYYNVWNRAASGQSKIIIGTRQALFLPFSNLETVIVIDPLHEFYKSDYSPKYKASALAEYVARLYGAQLVVISSILGVENYVRKQKKELAVQDTLKSWPATIEVVDLVAELKQGYVGALSVPLKRRIIEAVKTDKKVLIFASRRGYAGIIICKRCGFTVNCPRCDIPMRIHIAENKILVCHHCSTTQPYPQFCRNCHSSEIKPTGPAGSQKIFEELQKMIEFGQLTKTPIVILDSDVTKNQTEEDEIMETIRKPGPKILIATQKIFSYAFDDSFDVIAIPQFDALSISPDYQTTERLWYQLEKLADFNPRKIIIQTYDVSHAPYQIFEHDLANLYKEESEARESLAYPPFSKIVRLTFSHRQAQTAVKAGRLLIEKLKMAASHLAADKFVRISDSSPIFLSKERDIYTFTVIVKALPGLASLRELIKYTPSHWLIDVDPRQII